MIAAFLVGPRDSIRLDTFRLLTGISLIGFVATWWFDDAAEWLTDEGFHLSTLAVGSEWLLFPPLPLWALAPFSVLFFGAMVAFTLGFRLRVATWLTFLLLLYVAHIDPLATFTPHDLLLVTLAVFAVSAPGCYWMLDRRPTRAVSAWPLRVLQATLLLSYPIAGACKIASGGWMRNSFALREVSSGPYRTEIAAWLLRTMPELCWPLLQSLVLAFEVLAPLLFAVRRFRPLGLAWGAAMHLGIGVLMDELGFFALQMVAFYVLFVDDSTLHRVRERFAALGARQFLQAEGSAHPTADG